ncbi:hypothetical protein EV363DRAFT_1441762 [Boletus edulis]|nr:hypothetical protein EV363DRAFT_1441762 [Boletus edulis]
MSSFRDSSILIIETGRTVVRAGLGIHELLKTPTVEIPARVGLRQTAGEPSSSSITNGKQPSGTGEGSDYWRSLASLSRLSSLPFHSSTTANVNELSSLEGGNDILVSWPFADGDIRDCTQAEAIWKHIIFNRLQIKRTQNEFPGLSRASQERLCQIFFERFNVASFSIVERPMTQIYATGQLNGNPIQAFLLDLVKYIYGQIAEVEDEGVTDIAAVLVAGKEKAVIEAGTKKKATAKASAAEQARAREIEALDLITLQFRDSSITLGKERHRFCEPLFDPSLLYPLPHEDNPLSLQDTVGFSVSQTNVDQRQYIWQGLFVTGDLASRVKGIGTALQSRLSSFILGNPDQHNEVQPRSIRVVNVPEYFAEYREKGDGLAAFLGTSIVAKISFNDVQGKKFVSKLDYDEKGPRAVIDMSSALL